MNSYIVAEGPDGIYIIDQHAAHERIMFEKITGQREQHGVEVQGLLEPVTIEVLPVQDESLNKSYKILADFGFTVEPFGNRTYLVRTVPHILYEKDWKAALNELIDELSGKDMSRLTEEMIASMACHSAVRFGQSLSMDEIRELIRQMEHAGLPHACPHGRPTMIHITKKQLDKEFGRA
jgi:DNA mismatch repair protein MutL